MTSRWPFLAVCGARDEKQFLERLKEDLKRELRAVDERLEELEKSKAINMSRK